jgi:succinate dehydrogenase (ubiquinone) cytochrome b560 subunit
MSTTLHPNTLADSFFLFPRFLGYHSVVLYGYALAYLFVPGTFDSAHVIELVAGLPEAVKLAGKTVLAAPFAFHCLNGMRHLIWDTVKCEWCIL